MCHDLLHKGLKVVHFWPTLYVHYTITTDVALKDVEIVKLQETNQSLDEQLQLAMDDVCEKTTELETVSIESVSSIIDLADLAD